MGGWVRHADLFPVLFVPHNVVVRWDAVVACVRLCVCVGLLDAATLPLRVLVDDAQLIEPVISVLVRLLYPDHRHHPTARTSWRLWT